MPPPKQRPTGMVGKQELLRWVSEMCGRPVSSFSELKDGNALVTCVKETWPNAYDACRVSYPKRVGKDGGTPKRDQSSNYKLLKDMCVFLHLPPAVLDLKGIKASAFKACYDFLVCCFFLRNLALYSDFSVDFSHPVDDALALFLQSPDSVVSLRKGGALPEAETQLVTAAKDSRRRGGVASKRVDDQNPGEPTNSSVTSRAEQAARGHASRLGGTNGSLEKTERRGVWKASPAKEFVARTPVTASGSVFRPPTKAKPATSKKKTTEKNTPVQESVPSNRETPVPSSAQLNTQRSPSKPSSSLGRFLRRRASSGGVSGTVDDDTAIAGKGFTTPIETRQLEATLTRVVFDAEGENLVSNANDEPDEVDETDDPALTAARFEIAGLRRVLRLCKSEMGDSHRAHAATLDAVKSASSAETVSVRDAEKHKRRELLLKLENQRAEDQRGFLRELRHVAEETAASVVAGTAGGGFDTHRGGFGDVYNESGIDNTNDTSNPSGSATQTGRNRAALYAVRGREVAALAFRVDTLERERETLLTDLAAATVDDRDDHESLRKIKSLRDELRVAHAVHVADASSRFREIDELRVELRVLRNELADVRHAKVEFGDRRGDDANTPGNVSFHELLAEHRDNRALARLTHEKKQAADTNEALRGQIRALLADSGDGKGPDETTAGVDTPDTAAAETEINASAADAGAVLRAVDVLRSVANDALADLAVECDERTLASTTQRRGTVDAAAAAAEAATWRRAAASAVCQKRLLRAKAALATCEGSVETLEAKIESDLCSKKETEAFLKNRARLAEDDLARERAACGVRAALAETAEGLAREETLEALNEARAARAAASSAHGVSSGALRDARDTCAKLTLRETHWVGLVECHREAAVLSRLLVEIEGQGGTTAMGKQSGHVNGEHSFHQKAEIGRVISRRATLEATAQGHVESIEAICAMLPEDIRTNSEVNSPGGSTRSTTLGITGWLTGGKETPVKEVELTCLEARAAAAEAEADTLRTRLAKKTEDCASLALRSKRHELRATEASLVRSRAVAELRDAELSRNELDQSTTEKLAKAEAAVKKSTEQLHQAQAALEDRDAALSVGLAVITADPEAANLMMKASVTQSGEYGNEAARNINTDADQPSTPSPQRSFGGFVSNVFGSAENVPKKQESEVGDFVNLNNPLSPTGNARTPGDNAATRVRTRKQSQKNASAGAGTLRSPSAVAAAVAEATRAIASTPGSVESGVGGFRDFAVMRASNLGDAFVGMDDVVSTPSAGGRKHNRGQNKARKQIPCTSPGGESTGSVGTPTWRSSPYGQLASDDVIAAALANAAASAFLATPAPAPVSSEKVSPPVSPFQGLLNLFSPRRVSVGTNHSPLSSQRGSQKQEVDEETEDSQGTEDGLDFARENSQHTTPSEATHNVARVEEARGELVTPHTHKTTYTRDTAYSPTHDGGLSSFSPYAQTVSRSANRSANTLPGGSSFLREAEKKLIAIDVKREWFGLHDELSPSSKRYASPKG